jgi:hypothetical protein
MLLDGDDPGATVDERSGERARARSDVEHQVTGPNFGIGDQLFGPAATESVPSPSCPSCGHEASS